MFRLIVILLENALLRLDYPARFSVRATVSSEEGGLTALEGTATIDFPVHGVLPTLPDPYVASFTADTLSRAAESAGGILAPSSAGVVHAKLDWDATAGPAGPSLEFSQSATPAPSAAAVADAPDAAEVAAAHSAELGGNEDAVGAEPSEAVMLYGLLALAFRETNSVPGWIALLDVSGNADQFGVRLGTALAPPRTTAAVLPSPLRGPTIAGLSLVAPAHTVSVTTLPAVEWEPVHGSAAPYAPLAFPNSGGETRVTPRSVRLVPVAPNPALAQLLADYDDEQVGAGAAAFITFPFGIQAAVRLQPPGALDGGDAELDLHRPGFGGQLEGARQLRAAVPRPALGPAADSASFSGASIQRRVGPDSPIGELTGTFNGQFRVGGSRPQVPLDRFELSGYGENVFSDWRDESAAAAAITQVRFDVLNGRTAVEIVQARSILYPYGVRVVRTIKMLRDNAGRVQRTDSGWQAQTDGRYAWPRSELKTHPGVVRGVTAVKNIRDTSHSWTSAAGTELMAVRFDCLVDLEGVEGGVASREQLGFVQTTVQPEAGLSPVEFAQLIAERGPLGGTVDAVVAVGPGGLRSRVTRVGVGATTGTPWPEFAMAAWGSPVLPSGGPWSVVRRRRADPTPGPVDPTLGVPLIRAGHADAEPDPNAPYRFADPSDLATPDNPATDYALMHATDTQRVLFPRPKVELGGARAGQLSSSQPPVLADPFLMATAVGPFPVVATAIQFPDSDYGLRPLAGGDLALDLAHNDFKVGGGDRVIHAAGGNVFLARYRDESGNPAQVHIELDTGKPVPWAFSLGAMELCLSTKKMGEVIRLLGRIDASAAQPGRFSGGTIHFGGALDPIDVFIEFLGRNRLADLPLASRNHPSVEIVGKIPTKLKEIDVGIGRLADGEITVGMKVEEGGKETALKLELEGTLVGRMPSPGFVAVGQVKFELESGDSGNDFKFTLGFGWGTEAEIGPFKAAAYILMNAYVEGGTDKVGFGFGLEFKASIDLEVISAEIDVEAAGLLIEATCGAGSSQWLVGQLTVAVDITIAWVVDIDFEYQVQTQSQLDDGPCPAPMV